MMDADPIRKIISEDDIEKFFVNKRILIQFENCPICESSKIKRIRRSKYKCYKCHHEFGFRYGSIFQGSRIPLTKIVYSIFKFGSLTHFWDHAQYNQMNERVLSYTTLDNLFHLYRLSIALTENDSHIPISKKFEEYGCFYKNLKTGHNKPSDGMMPVFGIIEGKEEVSLEKINNMNNETLLAMPLKKAFYRGFIYTDRIGRYSGFISYHPTGLLENRHLSSQFTYMDRKEGFWWFAKSRLWNYSSMEPYNFPLHLKEIEFRYNCQNKVNFDILTDRLAIASPHIYKLFYN